MPIEKAGTSIHPQLPSNTEGGAKSTSRAATTARIFSSGPPVSNAALAVKQTAQGLALSAKSVGSIRSHASGNPGERLAAARGALSAATRLMRSSTESSK